MCPIIAAIASPVGVTFFTVNLREHYVHAGEHAEQSSSRLSRL